MVNNCFFVIKTPTRYFIVVIHLLIFRTKMEIRFSKQFLLLYFLFVDYIYIFNRINFPYD